MPAMRCSFTSAAWGGTPGLLVILAVCGLISPTSACAADSVGWRSDGSSQYLSATPVTTWTAEKNVLWKVEVGAGQSSPVLTGKRLLLTCEPDLLVCLDSGTGRELWRKEHKLSEVSPEAAQKGAEHSSKYGDATPTPVTDGQWVWVFFGTGLVACRDLDGNSRWMNWYDLSRNTQYGRTVSPVLVANRLLIHPGPLACLDPADGKLLWKNDEAKASYGTPVPVRIGDVDVVVTAKGCVVRVADGKTLATDVGSCMYTSPVAQDRIVYFVDSTVSAVQLPEKPADKIECRELWSADGPSEIYASPLVHAGRMYVVDKDAVLTVMEAGTGKVILNKELVFTPPATEGASMYASLAMAGNLIFAGNDAGQTVVLQADDQGTVVGSASLPFGSGATPVFSGKRIFVRAGKFVYCIAGP